MDNLGDVVIEILCNTVLVLAGLAAGGVWAVVLPGVTLALLGHVLFKRVRVHPSQALSLGRLLAISLHIVVGLSALACVITHVLIPTTLWPLAIYGLFFTTAILCAHATRPHALNTTQFPNTSHALDTTQRPNTSHSLNTTQFPNTSHSLNTTQFPNTSHALNTTQCPNSHQSS